MKAELLRNRSLIYSAILKYGHDNFSLNILEYCDKDILLKKEQYYIDLYKPKYNLLKVAGSRRGFKLSDADKRKLSLIVRNRKNLSKLNTKVNIDTKVTSCGENLPFKNQGMKVKVFDKSKNLVYHFSTMKEAAKSLDLACVTLRKKCKTGVSYDNYTYKFEPKDFRI
jgi:hypothetical protein